MIPIQLKAVGIFYLCKHIYSVLSIILFAVYPCAIVSC